MPIPTRLRRSRRVRPAWWVGAILTLAALVTLAVVAATPSAAEGAPVERFNHVHGLAIPSWADGDLFVATHEGLARVDSDGRWRWVGTAKHDFMGFQAHPATRDVLYASGHPAPGSELANPLGFMVSRDGGRSWEVRSLGGRADFHAMAVQASDGDVVYGFNSAIDPGLMRSLDAGATWERRGEALLALGGAYSLAIHPADRERLLAGTQQGLLASDDGGLTWQPFAIGDVPVTAVHYASERDILAYGAHPQVGLVRSRDGGVSWSYVGFLLEGGDAVGYIVVDPRDDARIVLGTFGMHVVATRDDGATWTALASSGVPQ
jgi:photosystem II stability/assembly factor-like uncharacterized protein